MANKKKVTTAAVAVAAAAALMLGGTFAWQSISQTALNEASDVINPGGRLHDDFYIDNNGDYNADIYVENFADDEIFARVKLQEYMEIVINQGVEGAEIVDTVAGSKSLDGTPVTDKPTDNTSGYTYEYVTHDFDADNATDEYWTWTTGDKTSAEVWYMPTFNMNKDSLVADRNGMYVDRIGGISNRSVDQYEDYTVWADGDTKEDTEIHDVDTNTADEVKYDFENLSIYETAGNIKTVAETHTAAPVGTTNGLISMSEWLDLLNNGEDTDDYWVYDTDGWVYWSSPIAGGETTGLLLDSIELKQVMDDTWYYAINAIGQFCTAGDLGEPGTMVDDEGNITGGTGFYADGETVSDDALTLLEHIGVNDTSADDDTQGPDEPEQTYNMHTYVYEGEEFLGNAAYLVPEKEYKVVVHAEQNEYGDTSVSFSVKKQDGTKLTAGEDYVLSETTAEIGTELDEQGYYHTTLVKLTILNDSLVGENIVVEAVADRTGNVATNEVAVHYEQKDVIITLYDTNGDAVAGTNDGGTLEPNATYDIVATIPNAANEDVVIYSTLDSQPVPDNIEVVDLTVYAHAGDYTDVNKVDSEGTGKLIVGDAKTFDCDEWMDDGITNKDALTLAVGADIVRIYESADAKSSGAEPTEIYYTYGQWDLYPTGQELYQVSVDDVLYISQGDHSDIIVVLDGNDANISADVTYQLEDNTDTNTKIEKSPATEDHLDEAILTIGDNETATELTITVTGSTGSGSKTVSVEYLNTLKIGEGNYNKGDYIYIDSSTGAEKTYDLALVDYWGDTVSNVTYAIFGADFEGTKVEGNMLTLAAGEDAYPMYLSVTADGVTTDYEVYVTPGAPSITLADDSDDTLDSLMDTVKLQLTGYDGTATWSTFSEDVTVTTDERGVATVAFKNFEGTEAPSAYEYGIMATYGEADEEYAYYTVKYAPSTYTPVHVENDDPSNGTYRSTEITDTIALGANRYVGYFSIKETAQVSWVATNQVDPSKVINEYGAFDESQLEQGNTYSVQAKYAKPDGTTGEISFTVSVEDSGLDM